MAKRPKLKMQRGEGPFMGKVESKSSGGPEGDKWRSVVMTAVTPWPIADPPVNAGEEIVWFAPNDGVFGDCQQGQIVEISRPGNSYQVRVVQPGEGVQVPAGQIAAAGTNREAKSPEETKRALAAAFDMVFDLAEWWNERCIKAALASIDNPNGKVQAKKYLEMTLDGKSCEALAVHLLMGGNPKYTLARSGE